MTQPHAQPQRDSSIPVETRVPYDGVADLYDRAFADIRVRRAEVAWLDEHLARSKIAEPRVLDLGCGTGSLLRHLSRNIGSGVGADVSSDMLAHAERRAVGEPKLSFAHLTRRSLPFADNQFDVVISFFSFRYLDWNRVFPEILRVLRPEGRFFMVDLVRARAGVADTLGLLRSALSHVIRREMRPGFAQDLAALVRHPAWSDMLGRHPMRQLSEYRDFFSEMLPAVRFDSLHTLPGRRVIALDSGPLGA
jgi:ubiquinone/menaquinone biosynthesis C-methylase UbiE